MERLTNRGTKEAKPDVTIRDVLNKLAEYENLEEQGKLLKLPFTVGDTYYRIENDGANPPYIREWKVGTIEFCVNVRDSIGKTVFLTREEAETALIVD